MEDFGTSASPNNISIHALTRSAIAKHILFSLLWYISIHALTRSAMSKVESSVVDTLISIHALTRSAIDVIVVDSKVSCHFNPRTHKECDELEGGRRKASSVFQSTHSQGVRYRQHRNEKLPNIFQSTHSQGVRFQMRPSYS